MDGPSPIQPSASSGALPRTVLEFPGSLWRPAGQRSPSPLPESDCFPAAIVVFSPSGGTGKTSLVANLGRALALDGEDVLLVDTSLQDSLVHYFGAARAYPGDIQTAYDRKTDTRVRLATLPVGCHCPGGDGEGWLRGEMAVAASECDRIVIDLSTASRWLTQQIFRMSPLLLVPMLPDWNSVLSLAGVRQFLEEAADSMGEPLQPHFLLNQFSPQVPFHRAVLEELRRRLGAELLPTVLHRSLDVDEALARGATVLDYEPDAQVSRDYRALAGWARDRMPCGCKFSSFA